MSLTGRAATLALVGLLAVGLAGCGGGDTPEEDGPVLVDDAGTRVAYRTEVVGSPSDDVTSRLEGTMSLFRRQDDGAPSLAMLRRRAEKDENIARRVLNSYGFYGATVGSSVAPPPVAPPPPADDANGTQADDAPLATATMKIEAGEPFVLTEHRFVFVDPKPGLPPDLPGAETFGSPVGAVALGKGILDAENAAVTYLRQRGRPWSRAQGRRAIADPDAKTLTVETRISPGPAAVYGKVTVEGAETVEPDHLLSYVEWEQGQPVDERELRDLQRDLIRTNLLDVAAVSLPETPPEAGGDEPVVVPVTLTVEERKHRTIGAGASYQTEFGFSVGFDFEHRNVAGRGERFKFTGNLGQKERFATFDYQKPQFLRPRQDFLSQLQLRDQDTNAFDETGATLTAGIERKLDRDDVWAVGIGGLVEYSKIENTRRDQDVVLFGIPGFVRYDGTDDKLNPTEGERLWVGGTPFQGFSDEGDAPFLRLESIGTIYRALDDDRRYVIAARGRVGTILSDRLSDVPSTRRFYSGGGTTVRGFDDKVIGALDVDDDPIGGRFVADGGTEFRARVQGDFGVVGFVEAGHVSPDPVPGDTGVQVAAGGGLRYYSPAGPIRFDIGFPLNPRPSDEDYIFYISIGQAY